MLTNVMTELDRARNALSDARDWLRSGGQPVGAPLTDQQAARRKAMWRAIDMAKKAIDRAKRLPVSGGPERTASQALCRNRTP